MDATIATKSDWKPLAGVVVVDLSRNLPGPLATKLFADLGATVTKVEPKHGEGLRHLPPVVDGAGVVWTALNRDKHIIEADFKDPGDHARVLALLDTADVVVEGFRPGVLDRLGLGWSVLHARNPRAILCSITGFGQSGPLARRAGHDLGYLAVSGVLDLLAPAGHVPHVPATQLADVAGGSWPATAWVLAALHERNTTGVGRHLDVAIADEVRRVAFLADAISAAGHDPRLFLGLLTGASPCCGVFATADGRAVAFSPLEPEFYEACCARYAPDLSGTAYLQGDDATPVRARWAALFASRTYDAWVTELATLDACVEPVRRMSDRT